MYAYAGHGNLSCRACFAKNFEMDLDANKVTYTLTEAKSGSVIFGEANTTGYIYIGQKPDTFVVKMTRIKLSG